MKSSESIAKACDEIKEMLLKKNASYGNSALAPMQVFSKSSALEQIKVRIDDKLSRLCKGSAYGNEDTILDLIGYLILLKVAMGKEPLSVAEETAQKMADLVPGEPWPRLLDKKP